MTKRTFGGKFDWNITFLPKNNILVYSVDSPNPDNVTVCKESVFFSQGSIKIMDSGFGRRKIIIIIRNIYIYKGGYRNIKHVFDFRRKKKYQTLYDPRFLTEHPSFTLRPAGTVTFTIGSVNSGSPIITETTKYFIYLSGIFSVLRIS